MSTTNPLPHNRGIALRPASPPLPAELRAALVEELARLLVADLARRPAAELLSSQLETESEAE